MAKKITVIGGGMGGYGAAIRATQLGAEVTLIEKDALGGTCLNRGCIPTKTLLQSAHLLSSIKKASTFGITAKEVSLDFGAVMKRKNAVIQQMVGGVTALMRRYKIKVIKGTGALKDPKTVSVMETKEEIKSDAIMIATGSKPMMVPIKGVDLPGVITSDQALSLTEIPRSLVVIGAGVIGLEFAQIYQSMGTKVTCCEMMPQALPNEDADVAKTIEGILKKDGIEIFTNAKMTEIQKAGNGLKVFFSTQAGNETREAEKVLISVGRKPNTEDLGAEKLELKLDRGRVVVNERMETSLAGVYAQGDAIGGIMLAHVALEEGLCAAENIMGKGSGMHYNAIPMCVYTVPEIASVGLNEAAAKKQHSDVKAFKFPFVANGRALTMDATEGFVKIITGKYGEILGANIIGPNATELIAEITLAIMMEATITEIASCVHAHPTLSEAIGESVMRALGKAIHI